LSRGRCKAQEIKRSNTLEELKGEKSGVNTNWKLRKREPGNLQKWEISNLDRILGESASPYGNGEGGGTVGKEVQSIGNIANLL